MAPMSKSGQSGKTLTNVLAALLLALLLTACVGRQVRIEECDVPRLGGETWADVAVFAVEAKSSLEICNLRIRAAQ